MTTSAKLLFTRIVLAFCFLSFAVRAIAGDGTPPDAEFIREAESRFDIFSLPKFEMKAALRANNEGKMLNGTYLLLWNGPDRWREEIAFPGYSEVTVDVKGLIYIKRTTDFEPLRVEQLHSVLGFGSSPSGGSFFHRDLRPNENYKKVQDRKINGIHARCLEIASSEGHERKVCTDTLTGNMIRDERFRDSGLIPIVSKAYPRSLSLVEEGIRKAEVEITELMVPEQISVTAFEPSQGVVPKPGCMNPVPWIPIRKVAGDYPKEDRRSGIQGQVFVYAVIAKNGVPQHLTIVQGVNPSLNQASLDGTHQWRFQPATCNGVPVDVETIFATNYTLGNH